MAVVEGCLGGRQTRPWGYCRPENPVDGSVGCEEKCDGDGCSSCHELKDRG